MINLLYNPQYDYVVSAWSWTLFFPRRLMNTEVRTLFLCLFVFVFVFTVSGNNALFSPFTDYFTQRI